MLRLTELKLPVGHSEAALKAAIVKKLGVPAEALSGFTIVRRGQDARKKTNILYVYTIDAEVTNEEAVLARAKDGHVKRAPDTEYKVVALAPSHFNKQSFARPLVVGACPCVLFAALILA